MARLEAQLILSLLDRVTAPSRGVAAAVTGLQGRIEANNRRLQTMQSSMLGVAATGYGLYRAIKAPTEAAIEFESAMADVRKVVNFETPAAFKQMGVDIINVSTEIPIAAKGIAAIVAAAGQAGMAGDELLGFTAVAAKAGVAFDVTADEAGTALAKIKTALGLTVQGTSELADAINYLSNTSASTAPDILDFMKRVGAFGTQYGFTAGQTAALGSAMIAAGAQSEVAATTFRNIGRALAKGDTATKRTKSAFRELGLSAGDVAKRLQKDAVGTLRDVIVRINKLPKHLQANTLSTIFGDEARALAPLVTQIDLYDKSIAAVADRANYLGSAQKEYEVRAATTANNLQLFRNKVEALEIAIGSALLPAINDVTAALGPVVMALARAADAHPALTRAVIGATAGLIALRIASFAARFSVLWMYGAVLKSAVAGLRVLQGVAWATAVSMRGIGAAALFMRNSVIAATIVGASGGFMSGVLGGLAAGAATIGTAIAAITAPIWAAIAAVVALGVAVFHYWEPISNFVAGFASVIGAALGGIIAVVVGFGARIATAVGQWAQQKLVDFAALFGLDPAQVSAAIDGVVQAASSVASQVVAVVKAIPGQIGGFLADIFSMKDFSDKAESGFRDAGRRAAQAFIDGIKGLVGYVADLGARVGAAIKSGASSVWNAAKGAVGLGSVPARAAGGPVSAMQPYLVGERGPELFAPSSNGIVINARDTAAMLSGLSGGSASLAAGGQSEAMAGGRGAPSITFGDIIVQGGAKASAEDIGRAFGREASALLRSHFTDTF